MNVTPEISTRASRTRTILERNKGKPDEWARLHAIMCMDHGWDSASSIELMKLIDGVAIATRLDEMQAAALASIRS